MKVLDVLSALPQLKSVRLETLITLSTQKERKALLSMEKPSLSLCEGFETINNINFRFFNLYHSSSLEEVAPSFYYMPYALMQSITNCHLIKKLPYDIGNLSSLKMLMLLALPGLQELPLSIGKLGQFECLDISFCEELREILEEMGQLKRLNELDMRKCSHLTRSPRAICELNSLKLVICDEKVWKKWLRGKNISIAELKVEID
ncbi:probable disease resistance protein At5g66900 [Cryptomeria japonica]|uniref:probable disease resistance protein At5g66900 n=1 Tax=Cryptomeria japonica TaxID=3369 RepID=UPI0027D9D57F|nr:probable disease resistance protein At5g66900 [Cryptomeria japonica]